MWVAKLADGSRVANLVEMMILVEGVTCDMDMTSLKFMFVLLTSLSTTINEPSSHSSRHLATTT